MSRVREANLIKRAAHLVDAGPEGIEQLQNDPALQYWADVLNFGGEEVAISRLLRNRAEEMGEFDDDDED